MGPGDSTICRCSGDAGGARSMSRSHHPLSVCSNWCTGRASKNSWAMNTAGASVGTSSNDLCHVTCERRALFYQRRISLDSRYCPWTRPPSTSQRAAAKMYAHCLLDCVKLTASAANRRALSVLRHVGPSVVNRHDRTEAEKVHQRPDLCAGEPTGCSTIIAGARRHRHRLLLLFLQCIADLHTWYVTGGQ